jgi:hypothetical protein
VKIVAAVRDTELRRALEEVAAGFGGAIADAEDARRNGAGRLEDVDAYVIEVDGETDVQALRAEARHAGAAIVFACRDGELPRCDARRCR